MNDLLSLPWLEAAIVFPLVGAMVVARVRDPYRAAAWGMALAAATFALTVLAAFAAATGSSPAGGAWDVQMLLFGGRPFALDELTVPLVPGIALLHLLTAVSTARTRMRRFSFAWSLLSESVTLATFACTDSWALVGLLAAGIVPPLLELRDRRRPVRVYLLHQGLFVGLLVGGWFSTTAGSAHWGPALLLEIGRAHV